MTKAVNVFRSKPTFSSESVRRLLTYGVIACGASTGLIACGGAPYKASAGKDPNT